MSPIVIPEMIIANELSPGLFQIRRLFFWEYQSLKVDTSCAIEWLNLKIHKKKTNRL